MASIPLWQRRRGSDAGAGDRPSSAGSFGGERVARPAQVPGLPARTPVRIAAEQLLATRLADVRAAKERAIRGFDEEAVHDLRVACRRLRAAIKLFGKKRLRAVDERIEELQDALGAVRDLQLQVRWLERHGAGVRQARARARLRKASARLRKALTVWTRSSEPLLLRELAHVRSHGRLGGKRSRRRLFRRLTALETELGSGDALSPESAHRIRVAAKKLRYEAELLRGAFDLDELLEAAAALQRALGDLHDADLRVRELGREENLASVARKERARGAMKARRALLRFTRAASSFRAGI
jgi:CHAD domain-containing protein